MEIFNSICKCLKKLTNYLPLRLPQRSHYCVVYGGTDSKPCEDRRSVRQASINVQKKRQAPEESAESTDDSVPYYYYCIIVECLASTSTGLPYYSVQTPRKRSLNVRICFTIIEKPVVYATRTYSHRILLDTSSSRSRSTV